MSRAARLLDLMQILRRHRRPVSGATLAAELGISLRTLYRDIVTLQAEGADIEGEPGLGYVLRPGFLLPPLMLSADEIEALALGSQWVSERADDRLAMAARNALAKLSAVLPRDIADALDQSGLMMAARPGTPDVRIDLAVVRQAIRAEHKLHIAYADQAGVATDRTIWPLALAFFDHVRVIVAWCELRAGFRHFRADRILRLDLTSKRYPQRRLSLLAEWRRLEGIDENRL